MPQSKNGKIDRLDDAMASLVQAQATLVQNHAAFVQAQLAYQAEMADLKRQSEKRFARIEKTLRKHGRLLTELIEMREVLDALSQNFGRKFGFQQPTPPQGTAS